MVKSNAGSWPAGLSSHHRKVKGGEFVSFSEWANDEFAQQRLNSCWTACHSFCLPILSFCLPILCPSWFLPSLTQNDRLAHLTLQAKLQLHYYVWDLFSPQFNINRVICRVLNWITNLLNDYFTSFVRIQINIYHFFQSNVYANVIHLLLLFILHLDPCSEDIIVT